MNTQPRGVSKADVDAELVALIEERHDLYRQVHRLKARIREIGAELSDKLGDDAWRELPEWSVYRQTFVRFDYVKARRPGKAPGAHRERKSPGKLRHNAGRKSRNPTAKVAVAEEANHAG